MTASKVPVSLILFCFVLHSIYNTLAADVSVCSCGYYDAITKSYYTDSLIMYFNESSELSRHGFMEDSYENDYEIGWNTRFRQAASPTNLQVQNSSSSPFRTSLELYVDPYTPDHLVVGGGIRTLRQDIQYGSFRSLLKPSVPGNGGTALSMLIYYNETESIQLSVINPDDPSRAWVNMLLHDEFPDSNLGVNFSTLTNATLTPWDFTEYRIDWSEEEIRFYVGGKLFRSVSVRDDNKLPSTPSALHLKHWSVGNPYSTQGPPLRRTVANVGWARMFFNSSFKKDFIFPQECKLWNACNVDEILLRGHSSYGNNATLRWRQTVAAYKERTFAIVLAASSISIIGLLLVNTFLVGSQRQNMILVWVLERLEGKSNSQRYTLESSTSSEILRRSTLTEGNFSDSNTMFGEPTIDHPKTPSSQSNSIVQSRHMSRDTSITQLSNYVNAQDGANESLVSAEDLVNECTRKRMTGGTVTSTSKEHFDNLEEEKSGTRTCLARAPASLPDTAIEYQRIKLSGGDEIQYTLSAPATKDPTLKQGNSVKADINTSAEAVPSKVPANLPTTQKRVDYLAGLVAFSCLLVTANHFILTFAPGVITPGAFEHYRSETWGRKLLGPYLLNLIWIGPFLVTSTRFLVATYLSAGDLKGVAQKTVTRPFRLMIPIVATSLLEYFLMDSGATNWLQSLPSVTWSTWPFTTVPNNLGNYISEILELAYLIPNAVPQITFNYCTGVLWTIPVQLQGSWTTLLSVLVIREIKAPWKRFGYYIVCMVANWYALSWGTYFYAGTLLADLEVTYKYRKYVGARPFIYYSLTLSCILVALASPTINLLNQWTQVNYSAYEYGIHPDQLTGRPIAQTVNAGYPQYYVPILNGITFSISLQLVVELCKPVQTVLGWLTPIFPHIYTIYLIHGFIFWSLGSWLCIKLFSLGLSYWLNLVIVAACCYSVLAIAVLFLTPVIDALGTHLTSSIWRFAHEVPAPRRPTLFPFSKDILLLRNQSIQR